MLIFQIASKYLENRLYLKGGKGGSSSSGQKEAAQATKYAADLQNDQFNRVMEQLAPYAAAGLPALQQIQQLSTLEGQGNALNQYYNSDQYNQLPAQLFTLARSFKANANGKIYLGIPDTDPTIPANQIPVYIESETGDLIPTAQPIVINAGGYPVYNGQISKFVTVQNYSMAVYDGSNSQQHYFPDIAKYDPDQLRQ